MSVRVRDLEIALVLAREMKAAAARSVDASLRLEQLQEVFGAAELDHAERARIQTALQMAGLEPSPSLLEADPSDPIRFDVAAKAAAPAGAGAAPAPPPQPPEEPPAEAPQTFPSVGQFARSKLGRSRRARRADRDDHGGAPTHATPVPEDASDFDDEPHLDAEPVEVPEEALAHEMPEETVAHEVPDETVAHEVPDETYGAGEPEAHEDAYDHVEPEPEPEPEELPYAPPPVGYAAYAEAAVTPEPLAQPAPAGAHAEEIVAALMPAVAIPVIVTSIAGWRFGLPFVALSVIASGWLLGRRSDASGESRGMLATLRHSPAAGMVLKATAVVTVLSVVASVLLASVGKNSTTTAGKKAAAAAKTSPPKPVAATPSVPVKPKHKHRHKKTSKPGGSQTTAQKPPPDPHTAGLVRVPPKSTTPSTGTGATRPGTQPRGTTTPPSGQTQPGTGTQPSAGTGSGPGTGTGAKP
jgi:hypothetical protein